MLFNEKDTKSNRRTVYLFLLQNEKLFKETFFPELKLHFSVQTKFFSETETFLSNFLCFEIGRKLQHFLILILVRIFFVGLRVGWICIERNFAWIFLLDARNWWKTCVMIFLESCVISHGGISLCVFLPPSCAFQHFSRDLPQAAKQRLILFLCECW